MHKTTNLANPSSVRQQTTKCIQTGPIYLYMVGLPQNQNEVFIACITEVLHSHIALLLCPLADDGKLPIESLEFIIERQCLFQRGHACEVKERIP